MPINRLFWKFFIYLWLAQFATLAGTSGYFWYRYAKLNNEYQAQQLAAAVEGEARPSSGLVKIDSPKTATTNTQQLHQTNASVVNEAPRRPKRIFPTRPLIIGTVASAIFAWLLAWSFARPITQLRNALNLAAKGNLDVRIGETMRKRNDELGDLGVEFDRMSSQLQQLISAQKTLLHDVSHEMRSPLARMQAIIGLIDQKPEQRPELLEKLHRESQRIDSLLAELLTMARLDGGLLTLDQQVISIEELLFTLVEDASIEAEVAKINIATDFNNLSDVHIAGEAELLYRALDNLLRNALKFTPPNGKITIRTTTTEQHLLIEIEDSGNGISEADLPLVTNPFFRSQNAKPINGYGLGLAMAKRLIEAHGGKLNLSNRSDGQSGLRAMITLNHLKN